MFHRKIGFKKITVEKKEYPSLAEAFKKDAREHTSTSNERICPNCGSKNFNSAKTCVVCSAELPGIDDPVTFAPDGSAFVDMHDFARQQPQAEKKNSESRGEDEETRGRHDREYYDDESESDEGVYHQQPESYRVDGRKAKTAEEYNKCVNCGALNHPENEFCSECQLSVSTLYIPPEEEKTDKKKIKIELKFPSPEGVVKCQTCGTLNDKNVRYCSQCQMELNPKGKLPRRIGTSGITIEEEDEFIRCSVCGYANHPDAEFCQDCSCPLREDLVPARGSDGKLKDAKPFKYMDNEYSICENCGALNPLHVRYCKDCQQPINDSQSYGRRQGKAHKKVELAFPRDDRFDFCPNCGACFEKGIKFCPDCAKRIDYDAL